MSIKLYNTLSRSKEEFKPNVPGHVGMYLCGPTVYSDAHLGHGKTAVAFDVIRRYLTYKGFKVRFVSNVTDVGHITTDESDAGRDRINERAQLEKLEPMQIADHYYWGYFEDMARLNVLKPDITPRATGHITEQIDMVQTLMRRGLAYERGGSVYFRVRAFPGYGKLSGREQLDELEVGTREEVREEKEDPRDFALWKHAEPEHIMRWPSPWGAGFPGWHIECSAMALKYLGDGFDIHGGGLDLQFPHHEAEIAQAEGAGHTFARYWMHGNMLTVGGEKMSKSKGNFLTLKDFYATSNAQVLRFNLVTSHYRSITEISNDTLQSAQNGYNRLLETKRELERRASMAATEAQAVDAALQTQAQLTRDAFETAMNDDFNTPEALAALFHFSKTTNTLLLQNPSQSALENAHKIFTELGEGVLGLFPAHATSATNDRSDLLEALIDIAAQARQGMRSRREWAQSDALRDRLKALGLTLEDTPDGVRWKLA